MDGDEFGAQEFTVIDGGAASAAYVDRMELVRDIALRIGALSQMIVAVVAVPESPARPLLRLVLDELGQHL